MNEEQLVINASDLHSVVDSIRGEVEGLKSNQPGPQGRLASYDRLAKVADNLLAAAKPLGADPSPLNADEAEASPEASANN